MNVSDRFLRNAAMIEVRVLDGDSAQAQVTILAPFRVSRNQSVADLYSHLHAQGILRGKELQCDGAVIRHSSNLTFAELVGPDVNSINFYVVKTRHVTSDKFQLLKTFEGKPIHIQEDAVKEGAKVLEQLLTMMRKEGRSEEGAADFIKQITETMDKANIKKTVIGVVGTTGAGKSSLINALLDEEHIVPTSSMKACTAVVTEITYNQQASKYRAEIEFIDHESWRNELTLLMQEEANGVVHDPTSGNIAPWHKVKAVYPYLTKDSMQKHSVEELMANQAVAGVLGITKTISHNDVNDFYNELQAIVDSKMKTNTHQAAAKNDSIKAYWPLIKVIRIFVKHEILESGLVIVDLPGVQDSNAAREEVAQDYMQNCSGLFMISPITRAVSDKTAKELLGERFRRQMKMDCGYINNVVTFVATKTDDISVTEAVFELGLEENSTEFVSPIEKLEAEARALEAKIARAKIAKASFHRQRNELEATTRNTATKKRSAQEPEMPSPKKIRRSTVNVDSNESGASASSANEVEEVTNTDVSQGESLESRILDLDAEIDEWEKDLAEMKNTIEELQTDLLALCIRERNRLSKQQIQTDFAAGIREIDDQLAYEKDPNNFDPTENVRDYKAVSENLPVFCVSSRAYQKLCGRLVRDTDVHGFPDVESTSIPQLQEHCRKLIFKTRKGTSERFLTSLSALLNTCLLSVRNRKTAGAQHAMRLSQLMEQTQARLIDLNTILEGKIDILCQGVTQILRAQLNREMIQGAEAARDAANATAAAWGRNPYQTYQAICRRNGSFRLPEHAWNELLAEPLIRNVAQAWEACFGTTIQQHLRQYAQACGTTLRQFHEVFLTEAEAAKVRDGIMELLGELLNNAQARCIYDADAMIDVIQSSQRDINRDFVPAIQERMIEAYVECAAESGRGMFARMKSTVEGHVSQEKRRMFHASIAGVSDQLDQLVHTVRQAATTNKNDLITQFSLPYVRPMQSGPTPNYALQNKLADIIEQAEQAFSEINVKHEEEEADDADAIAKSRIKLEQMNGQHFDIDGSESPIFVDDDE